LAIQLLVKGKKVPSLKRNPRTHQQEAIAASKQYFLNDKNTRGKLIMPCGTGKSLTAYWITQTLASKATIIAVPSLALIKQSLEDWTKEMLLSKLLCYQIGVVYVVMKVQDSLLMILLQILIH